MDRKIKSQLNRTKELFFELENACLQELRKISSDSLSVKNFEKIENLSQEVLCKIKHLLDQSMYKFFESHYSTDLLKRKIYNLI